MKKRLVIHATGKPNLRLGGAEPLCRATEHEWTTTCYATCLRCIRILRSKGEAHRCVNTPEWKRLQRKRTVSFGSV